MRNAILGLTLAGILGGMAFAQPWPMRLGASMPTETFVLIWISALELSSAQMESLLKLVDELMPLRDEIAGMPEKFHEDLLRFTGTTEELRELLSAYRNELQEKLQTLEDKFADGLKKILTVAQWEKLQRDLLLEEGPALRKTPTWWRGAPRAQPERPTLGVRLELWRGMTLVRILPVLKEALADKLAAVKG